MEVGTEPISFVTMYVMYTIEKKGVMRIAREFKLRNGTVCDLLDKYGLSKSRLTKEWFTQEYVERERNLDDIAQELGVDESSVRYHLRQHDIPIRYKSRGKIRNNLLRNRDWLFEQYVTKLRSLHDIADMANCRVSSVVRALTVLSIARPDGAYGITSDSPSRRRQFTGKARQAILERDGQRCRFPECTSTVHLELHHIIPMNMGGVDTVTNGITLCKKHHRGIAARENDYIEMFQNLIQEPLA